MAHAPETDAQLHFVEYINRTTSYAVGSNILIDAVFNRPFTATGTKLHIELAGGKIVQADLDTTSDGERILKYSYTITSSDDTSTVSVVDIVGTLKKKPKTALSFVSGDIRDSSSGATTIFTTRSVKDLAYGAQGDGVVDDSDAIQSCLNAGNGTVLFPAGTYKITKTITVPNGVSLLGEGQGVSTVTWASSDATVLTGGVCFLVGSDPSFQQISGLSADVKAFEDRTLSFSTDPGVSRGDWILIFNETDSSFAGWRTYYKAGEYLKVASVSGTTVTIEGSPYADYAAADIKVYKKTNYGSPSISGLTIIGNPDTVTLTSAVKLNGTIGATVSNCEIKDGSGYGIFVWKCINTSILHSTIIEDHSYDHGADYGISFAHCQNYVVDGCYVSSGRTGISSSGGGSASVGQIPCRGGRIVNTVSGQSGLSNALDFHGNCEYGFVTNCTLNGTLTLMGDHHTVVGNVISGLGGASRAVITVLECLGLNHIITDNDIVNTAAPASRGAILDCGGDTNDVTSNTTRKSNFVFCRNRIKNLYASESLNSSQINIVNRGSTAVLDLTIEDNIFDAPNAFLGPFVKIEKASGSRWSHVKFNRNFVTGAKLFNSDFSGGGADETVIDHLDFDGNTIKGFSPKDVTTEINFIDRSLRFTNNYFYDCRYRGLITGLSTDYTTTCVVFGNVFEQTPWGSDGTVSNDATMWIKAITNLIVTSNFIFNNSQKLIVASSAGLAEGNTVYGQTSTEEATIYEISSTGQVYIKTSGTGTFTGSETLEERSGGVATGDTTTFTAQQDAMRYDFTITDCVNVWRDNNVNNVNFATPSSKSTNVATITNDDTTI